MLPRRVLLVEQDPTFAQVIKRALERSHSVVVAPNISRAVATLAGGTRFHVVVAGYRLRGGTAGKLFALVHRRWPEVKRILYADPTTLRSTAARLADSVVDTRGTFDDLVAAITT